MSIRAKCLTAIAILVFASLVGIGLNQHLAAAAPPSGHGVAVGVNFNCIGASDSDQTMVYTDLQNARVGWARVFLPWYWIEPDKPGLYAEENLARFQACVDQARAHGLHVLVELSGTPTWAGKVWDSPPHPSGYASALGYLARRYPQVSAWEVWNEENAKFFWRGTAAQYVKLLRMAYRAVKRANPRALVIFGGTAHSDAGWIRKCYRAGAKGYFDVLATHPYPWNRKNIRYKQVIGFTREVRGIMAANHDTHTPIWFTEFGWSRPYVGGARGQAVLLHRSFVYIEKHLPYVRAAFWYEIKTEEPDNTPRGWLSGLSLLTPSGGVTQAYKAMVAYSASS